MKERDGKGIARMIPDARQEALRGKAFAEHRAA
jgi:hypothetical protein